MISYNPAAGRSEFQVADDYRAGGTARLRYANRALCLACHQNAAPIFSRQSWTNRAPTRALPLRWRRCTRFLRSPGAGDMDIPNAIDDATDRANRCRWPPRCGARPAGTGARQGVSRQLLRLALRQRLAGGWRPRWHCPRSNRLVGPFCCWRNWRSRWPEGIRWAIRTCRTASPLPGLGRPMRPTHAGACARWAADISAASTARAAPTLEILASSRSTP